MDADGPSNHGRREERGLDASFVHLALPSATAPPSWTERASRHASHEGLLETVRHASELLRAAQGKSMPMEQNDYGVSLCQDCIDRVARAIEEDTERLRDECFAYGQAVTTEHERQQSLRKALLAMQWPTDAPDDDAKNLIARTEASFLDEIAVLEALCDQHEQELEQLQSLQTEQLTLTCELNTIDDCLDDQFNMLKLEARAFGHVRHQFSETLRRAQLEAQALSSVKIHSALFNLVVDKRGLRYPLINDLRLAYRPKGDVQWGEINAAWAQAAQLVLLIAASVKFQSRNWRIVPLTLCAKLIYLEGKHRTVYSLGGNSDSDSNHRAGMAVALQALNALMDQICRHVNVLCLQEEDTYPLPYEITRSRIGTFDLSQLDDSNDSSWSRVIHCVASNLQWLADRASEFELESISVAL